ncbi:flavin-containing monooxygenase [Nocardioides acrostichi]|uniref:NAD(P)/FAD-dependent oxidoreductase n=1 Tax=Nocardioides acrostichi TaxID=2784339 RepID=A0A930USU1_9ACTN|nr:NAD(P)/FAD-dependent oxidoreductase [Nocardioides acrostichi]MBF4160198.1 NAD(P)/FAD-dependent oxidoreductase [Nocardioides acrostichi]
MPRSLAVDHVIVGAGFAGIAAAIKLDEDGERDVVVLEKGHDVGGTWRDNTYPGAACDVPSQLYSFSFAPNPDWSMSFSPQPEIQAYIERVARESGVLERFRFDTEVTAATWDGATQRWHVTARGPEGEQTYVSRTLITGTGALSEPKLPEIEGIDGFTGELFHSAQWDADADLAGKRVAVIGTGASAIQIVPKLQEQVAHLDLYQRTAPYVMPRHDRTYSRLERAALRHVPGLQKLYRTAIYWGRETYVPGFTWNPALAMPAQKMALKNLADAVADPDLRAALTPDFQIGCKRILISNTYYPAVASDNVELVTDGIARIDGNAILTRDGTRREVDVLVVATGFATTDLPIAHLVTGRTGETLAERWTESGMAAYKGTTVPEFPNLFTIVGPNTGLGHSSMVFIIESQVAYLRDAIRTMRAQGLGAVEPTEQATSDWNDDLHRRMRRTVWNSGGCASWYLDEHGRNTTLWPRTTFTFRRLLARFDAEQYVLSPEHTTTPTQEVVSA